MLALGHLSHAHCHGTMPNRWLALTRLRDVEVFHDILFDSILSASLRQLVSCIFRCIRTYSHSRLLFLVRACSCLFFLNHANLC